MNINSIIYKALKTKDINKVKGIDILHENNILVIDNENVHHSNQGYVTLKHRLTERILCISKTRDNKTALFDPWGHVVYNDRIKKVDFLNFLTTPKRYPRYFYETKTITFKRLLENRRSIRCSIHQRENDIISLTNRLSNAQRQKRGNESELKIINDEMQDILNSLKQKRSMFKISA